MKVGTYTDGTNENDWDLEVIWDYFVSHIKFKEEVD